MPAPDRTLLALLLLGSVSATAAPVPAPAAKVIGGNNAGIAPAWMAGLHFFSASQNAFALRPFCGGSLIAPGWVISAGHCFVAAGQADTPAAFLLDATEILIRLDSPDLSNQPEHFVRLLRVHPQFGVNSEYDSDIALLQLAEKVPFQPVSLADTATMARLDNSSTLDDVVRILGWGIFDDADFVPGGANNNFPLFLQSADIDYLPFSDRSCSNAWPQMTANMLCAREIAPQPVSEPFGQDACSGDSGGPLLLPRGSLLSDGLVTQDWLLGATSFGPSSCVSTFNPGVYTRLSNFTDWIEQVSASTAAADPLVDIAVTVDIADELNPDQDVLLPIRISNHSSRNQAGNLRLLLNHNSQLSLTAPADQGCIAVSEGWQCALPDTLNPGMERTLTFSGNWHGDSNTLADIRANVAAEQNDYRLNNNEQRARPRVTLLSDHALTHCLIRDQGTGFITLAINAENRSGTNAARNSRLLLAINHGITLQSADPRCIALDSDAPRCQLGDLPTDSRSEIVITLRGDGSAQIRADLVADNGDSSSGDSSQIRNLSLRRSSSGGGAFWWWLPALALYRLRKLRSQSRQ